RGVGFDDSGWPSGPAPFGYSSDPAEGPFGTTLTDMRNSYTCLFLRNAFVVDNPARVSELQLAGVCDDGFILWVNGEEAARVNVAGAPGTPAPYDALAASSTEPTAWSATLTGSALPALRATNIVAVQVFNGSLGSSDLVFDLRMIAQQGSALPPAEDADFDGMHDDWETAHLSGLSDPSDRSASGDPDGDGLSNLEEYIAGTDPRAKPADAAPGEGGFMVDVQLVGEQVDVSFPTLAASGTSYAGMTRHYALESCAGAGGMDWLVVSGYEDIAGAGQTVTYTAPPSAQPALYRARVWLAKEREPPPPPADRPAVIGFTHPADGASVSGSFTVTAEAYDPDVGTADGAGILKVVFELRTGTTLVASRQENNATYIWPLDTTAYANGAYLLRAIATSTAAAGGGSASAEIGITIDNAAPPPGDYTLYKTWGQVYAGVGARYATVKRISDPGTSSNPNYTGFWFYGTLQFDPTGRYSLGMQVHFQNRDVRATDSADIGVIDLQNGNRWTPIGTSTAWNWQQGNRLQWRPHSDEILWNDRSDDGTHYVCRVYNFKTGARRTLPRPIYGVSADGRYALTQDFERMTHGGTNYVGIPDPYAGQKAPAGTGFWRMDLDSGAATLILSLQEFAALAGYTGSANIYAFRSESNYSGSRWRCVVKADGAAGWGFIMNGDGGDVRFPTVPPSGAHTTWLDNDTVISGELKTWEDENGGTPKTLVTGVPDNDPAMVMGTTYPDWVALDTYPLSNGYQYLTLFHLPTQTFVPLARLKNAAPSGVYRVDLHVRSSRDGRTLSFDSSHEGSGRQLYLVDIGYILDNPPQG
ncbi:MAG: hypothetical protein JXR37_24255, partial [Kiritimatiellae bacterium]|nr:hypothetical protein [Kiritimatiellia bacterium]